MKISDYQLAVHNPRDGAQARGREGFGFGMGAWDGGGRGGFRLEMTRVCQKVQRTLSSNTVTSLTPSLIPLNLHTLDKQ